MGQGFYCSIAQLNLQKQCKNYPKVHSQTKGTVAPSRIVNTPLPLAGGGFCRAMRCISAAYAVVRCMSIRLFVYSVEMRKHILNFFHRRVATPFEFFRTKLYGNNPTGIPITGSSNASGVWKIAIFDQYLASWHVVNAATVRCYQHGVAEPWQVDDTHRW